MQVQAIHSHSQLGEVAPDLPQQGGFTDQSDAFDNGPDAERVYG